MKTPMPPPRYWCPHCNGKTYKSRGNLNNHIEQYHEPQKHHFCNECRGLWNTALGCSRHVRRSGCSGRHIETRHHELKKSLYACGVCARVFDDFGLRQDHLFTHQQSGVGKGSWDMNNVMLGLLSHSSIIGSWNAAIRKISNNHSNSQWQHRWDWSDPRASEALTALEYMRFDHDQDLDRLLDTAISTLTSTSKDQLQAAGQEVQLNPGMEVDFSAFSEEEFEKFLHQLENIP